MTIPEYTVKQVELIAFKKRKYVRTLTNKAIRSGKLIRPSDCELCCRHGKVEAHHVDYGRPFAVTWLCKRCHVKAHKNDHPLNPDNNHQSAMPHLIDEYKNISITFQMPIGNFLALQNQSEKTGKPIATILRDQAQSAFPVFNPQMQFNLEVTKNDKPQDVKHERVQSLATNEGLRQQSKCTVLQKIWRSRNYNLRGMEQQLFAISERHGQNARGMQRLVSY